MLDNQRLAHGKNNKKKQEYACKDVFIGLLFSYMKEKLQKILDRINELQQIIDLETDVANEGCVSSQQFVINAEHEKDELQDQLDSLALWIALT